MVWTAPSGVLGGAGFVKDGGVDFTLLEPVGLAVARFVTIPAVAGALTAGLTERWLAGRARTRRRLARMLAAVPASIAVVPTVIAVVGEGARATLGGRDAVRRLGTVTGALALAVVALVATLDLAADIDSLLL